MTLAPSLRKFALTLHVASSVGWLGAVAAYFVLDLTVATNPEMQMLRAAYLGMALIVKWAIVPLALGSLLTGLIMSLGTKWGLFRHYWVVISLVLTILAILVLLAETQPISRMAEIAADPATPLEELRSLPNTLIHSVGGSLILLVIQALNIYKPQGLTPYGWRKQQALRTSTRLSQQI
jgi:MFS family permease